MPLRYSYFALYLLRYAFLRYASLRYSSLRYGYLRYASLHYALLRYGYGYLRYASFRDGHLQNRLVSIQLWIDAFMIWTILFQILIIEFCHGYTSISMGYHILLIMVNRARAPSARSGAPLIEEKPTLEKNILSDDLAVAISFRMTSHAAAKGKSGNEVHASLPPPPPSSAKKCNICSKNTVIKCLPIMQPNVATVLRFNLTRSVLVFFILLNLKVIPEGGRFVARG